MGSTQSTKNFQVTDTRKFLLIVRFKPAPAPSTDLGMLGDAVSGVNGAVDKVKQTVNDAASSIPGLKMFVKEEKKESSSEKEYSYDYSQWDQELSRLDSNLKELYSGNKAELFEFSAVDFNGRKQEGQRLFSQVNTLLASCKNYKAQLFFIGIGQGGNVVNECASLLAADQTFKTENWHVEQVVYVATPLYKEYHLLPKEVLKKKGQVLHVANAFDLTHQLVEYMDDKDRLLKCIGDVNKSTLTLLVGKVQLELMNLIQGLVKVIRDFTDLHVGDGTREGESMDDKTNRAVREFEKQKNDLDAFIGSLLNFKDPILDDLKSMLDTGSLKQLEEVLKGLDRIPKETAMMFIADVTAKASEIANRAGKKASDEVTYQAQKVIDENINRHTGGGSSARQNQNEEIIQVKDLAALFHCLHVPLNAVKQALKIIGSDVPLQEELAAALIKRAGVTKILSPLRPGGTTIDISDQDPYREKIIRQYQDEKKIDQVKVYIHSLCGRLDDLTAKGTVEGLSTALSGNGQQREAGMATALLLSALVRPMLASKQTVINEILSWFKNLDLTKLLDDDLLSRFGLKPLGLFSNEAFKKEMQWYENDIREIEQEFNRLKSFFGRLHYEMQEDTLCFVYNAHHIAIQKPAVQVLHAIDKQTGIYDFKVSKGFVSSYPDGNHYTLQEAKEKNDVKPVEVQKEQAA